MSCSIVTSTLNDSSDAFLNFSTIILMTMFVSSSTGMLKWMRFIWDTLSKLGFMLCVKLPDIQQGL
jgi:hypothetical protein